MDLSFHKNIYKIIQRIKGKRVFHVLNQMEESQWYDHKKIKELQWEKIKNIIMHSYSNIPYYKHTFMKAGITPDDINSFDDLKRIPVLTKNDLRNEQHALLSKKNNSIYTKYSTSGSTNVPSVVYADRNSEAYRHAAVFRSYRWIGFDAGDKIARFWGTQLDFKKNINDKIKDLLLNRITFSTKSLDHNSLLSYYNNLIRYRPKAIYGFSSAVFEFAQFLKSQNLPVEKTGIKGIIVTGERILPFQRELIEDVFKCKVFNNYACEEFATIAFECPQNNLHLMSENVYVEVEKAEDDTANGNLLITDLNNYLMPLIRYRIGDIGNISYENCSCGRGLPVLKEISGRTVDFIKTPDGKIIHGISFDYLPKYFLNEIKQFQIIQEHTDVITVNLVKDKEFNNSTIQNFQNRLRNIVGDEVKLNIVSKENIPRMSRGKFRFVISKLN